MGEEGYELVSVFFGNGHTSHTGTPAYVGNATMHHDYYADGDTQMEYYVGTATFSISGTTLTLQMLGQTYTLTKEE